jgi:hypothetical protein
MRCSLSLSSSEITRLGLMLDTWFVRIPAPAVVVPIVIRLETSLSRCFHTLYAELGHITTKKCLHCCTHRISLDEDEVCEDRIHSRPLRRLRQRPCLSGRTTNLFSFGKSFGGCPFPFRSLLPSSKGNLVLDRCKAGLMLFPLLHCSVRNI